jgi:hypothetical protein
LTVSNAFPAQEEGRRRSRSEKGLKSKKKNFFVSKRLTRQNPSVIFLYIVIGFREF